MPVTAIVGAQWGDEGKGRVVDYLAQSADLVVRYQGGDNAGHTVINKHGTFRLHLIPSGIFNPEAICLLGTGMAINPTRLIEEMQQLRDAGLSLDGLAVSAGAQMLMPYHVLLDQAEERARGASAIGTTGRGIGPAYADKAARNGLRMGDLLHPEYLRGRLELVLPRVNRALDALTPTPSPTGRGEADLSPNPSPTGRGEAELFPGPSPLSGDFLTRQGEQVGVEEMLAQCRDWAMELEPLIVDPVPVVRAMVENDRRVLLEGQLGVMRDLDWGIYPYVTSSNPIAGGASAGAGLPPAAVKDVIGVVKAYSTCVGAGPFPVELNDEVGQRLREVGGEYGATTGRPRRCGWLDAVALRRAGWLNGFTGLAATKLDVLDSFPELKICVAYRIDEVTVEELPHTALLERAEPVYETWPGWQRPTRDARRWEDLPFEAQAYLARVAELAGAPIRYVSVGAEREAMIEV